MTKTEKMVQEMNGFFREIGEDELTVPKHGERVSELELLGKVKEEYKRRLLEKIPQYRSLRSDGAIPDLFFQALRKRESEMTSGLPPDQ